MPYATTNPRLGEKDIAYLETLSPEQKKLLDWCAQHPPQILARTQIPHLPAFLRFFDSLPDYTPEHKLFPSYKAHRKACKILGLRPAPRFAPGTPPDIAKKISSAAAPPAHRKILECLYNISYYSRSSGARICEVSSGLIHIQTQYSLRTIAAALDYLRQHRYILRIWRGRPNPRNARYLHSAYELPSCFDHVLAWRIHHGRLPHRHL